MSLTNSERIELDRKVDECRKAGQLYTAKLACLVGHCHRLNATENEFIFNIAFHGAERSLTVVEQSKSFVGGMA